MIVDDLRTETRFSDPPVLNEYQVVSGMSVIIGRHKQPWGVLGVYTTRKRMLKFETLIKRYRIMQLNARRKNEE